MTTTAPFHSGSLTSSIHDPRLPGAARRDLCIIPKGLTGPRGLEVRGWTVCGSGLVLDLDLDLALGIQACGSWFLVLGTWLWFWVLGLGSRRNEEGLLNFPSMAPFFFYLAGG
ncbi:uncharacterized protein BO97DRAFT_404064, partial [Aspergillus homomorphus CBS 101889]